MAKAAAMMTDTEVHARACSARPGRGTSTRRSPRRCTRTSRRSACRQWSDDGSDAGEGAAEGAEACREIGPGDEARRSCGGPVDRDENTRRRLGRHRRHLVERADGDAALPVEHPRPARATTGRTRSRWRRRSRTRASTAGAKVAGDDGARSADAARARRRRRGTTSRTCRRRTRSTSRSSGPQDKPAIWLNKETHGRSTGRR